MYELQSVGSTGDKKYFHKPWMMTSIMFLGEWVGGGCWVDTGHTDMITN